MKNSQILRSIFQQIPANVYAVILLLTLLLIAVLSAQGQDRVTLKGKLIITGQDLTIPTARLIASDGEEMILAIKPNGKFWVNVPAGDAYDLVFEQGGHIAKTVRVDTRNSGLAEGPSDETVKFDIIMFPQDELNPMVHTGPIGLVTFDRNGEAQFDHLHAGLRTISRHSTLLAQELGR